MNTTPYTETSCDKEQIQFIAEIQTHGALLCMTKSSSRIVALSDNADAFLKGLLLGKVDIGKKLTDLFPPAVARVIEANLPMLEDKEQRRFFEIAIDTRTFDVHLFPVGTEYWGIEFEADVANRNLSTVEFLADVQRFSAGNDVEKILELGCRTIRLALGFDRVMYYKFFRPSWDGKVLAEDRNSKTASFLHHVFPGADIPKPARDLYLKNAIRYISNSSEKGVPVKTSVVLPKEGLDLTHSRLRASAEVHREYLKNMGVVSSLSIAVESGGELEGLFACHSEQRVEVSVEARAFCMQVVAIISRLVPALERMRATEVECDFVRGISRIQQKTRLLYPDAAALFLQFRELLTLFRANAVYLVDEQDATPLSWGGDVLPVNLLKEVIDRCQSNNPAEGTVFYSNSLGHGQNFSGALVVKLARTWLILTRPEVTQTLQWAGNVKEARKERSYEGRIHPRKSFETWQELVGGLSLPWESYEIDSLKTLLDLPSGAKALEL